ncbi:hypothetical protein H3H37_25330 [Duganella sp. LX20W]|uniref:Uncharacterized protein n=1 Tax=Rugamonas brunnea TaxID=2758569 RepID=A0A7W2EXG1_9BURK|nr:hypothetical protein [Rugamonas brunnea]MBA5640386.1 hypothetical protein [Rugamonas brunnea]
MEYVILLVVGLVIYCLYWGYRKIFWHGVDQFYAMMADLNKRHGTSFGTTREDYNTVIGRNTAKGVMAFDKKNRKIAYVTKAGKQVEILDYKFIRTWRITYDEKTSGGGIAIGATVAGSGRTTRHNVAIEIGTTDINRPTVRIWMLNYAHAQDSIERLDILINH